MLCSAYCTVTKYQLPQLLLAAKEFYKIAAYRDVVHVETKTPLEDSGQVFYFSYGVVVLWNVPTEQHQVFLKLAEPFSEGTLEITESEEIPFAYGQHARIVNDEIVLPDTSAMTKLGASHAIAQATKLGIFEKTLAQMIRKTEYIPKELASTGSQPLSGKDIRRILGQLFIDRSSINLHFDLLDQPEFFWDYAELEPIYNLTSKYLDIEDRVTVLNQRLVVIGELFQMLSDELKHKHSARLEWTIIWLIVIEVVISLGKDVFAWI